jgi:hypothetical protein
MKFSVYKGEKDISDLTARLYEIKGRSSAAAGKKAEAALLSANPHIRDLTKVPEGTLIAIPDLPDSPPLKVAQTAAITADLGDHLKQTLKELNEILSRSAETEESEATASNDALKDRELREFMSQSPEAKEQLDRIAEATKNRLKEAKAAAAAQKEAVAQLQDGLGKIDF